MSFNKLQILYHSLETFPPCLFTPFCLPLYAFNFLLHIQAVVLCDCGFHCVQ